MLKLKLGIITKIGIILTIDPEKNNENLKFSKIIDKPISTHHFKSLVTEMDEKKNGYYLINFLLKKMIFTLLQILKQKGFLLKTLK